jgi:hypothetical protein
MTTPAAIRIATPAQEHGSPVPGYRLAYALRRVTVAVPVLIPDGVPTEAAWADDCAVVAHEAERLLSGGYGDAEIATVEDDGCPVWADQDDPTE